MGDLVVDLHLVASTAGELEVLSEEFDRAGEIPDDYDIGSSDVRGALHEFATNWKIHKKKLLSNIGAVHDMLTKTHESFIGADNQLVQDLASAPKHDHIGEGG